MNFDALGWNPAPGSPDAVLRVSSLFNEISGNAATGNRALHAIAATDVEQIWDGEAATAFRTTLEQLCVDLTKLHHSYEQAASALTTYGHALADVQYDAGRAESDASAAVAERDSALRRKDHADGEAQQYRASANRARLYAVSARRELNVAQATGDVGTAQAIHDVVQRQEVSAHQADNAQREAESRSARAESDAGAASSRLEAARRLARQAQELRENAAETARRELHEASEQGIHPRPLIERWRDNAITFVNSEGFDRFLTVLSDIGSMVSGAAWVVGLFNPGMGATLAAVGFGLQAVSSLGRLARAIADPSKTGELLDSGLALGMSALTLTGVGAIAGKAGLKYTAAHGPKAELTRVGRWAKRAFSPTNNTQLHGVPRKLMWTRFHVEPLPARFAGPEHATEAARYFSGKALIHGGVLLQETAQGVRDVVDSGTKLWRDITDYRRASHDEVLTEQEHHLIEIGEHVAGEIVKEAAK